MKKSKFRPQPKTDVFLNNGTPPQTAGYEPFDDAVQALQATDTELIDEELEDEETGADFILPESYHIQEDPFLDSTLEEVKNAKDNQEKDLKDILKKSPGHKD